MPPVGFEPKISAGERPQAVLKTQICITRPPCVKELRLSLQLLLYFKILHSILKMANVSASQLRRTAEYTKTRNIKEENYGVASFNNNSP